MFGFIVLDNSEHGPCIRIMLNTNRTCMTDGNDLLLNRKQTYVWYICVVLMIFWQINVYEILVHD